ncbi:MAG: flagellar hook-length control protein FliK [Magnetovibrionaceae bacterium]
MDVSEVKSRIFGGNVSQAGQAQQTLEGLGGLPVNFADMMQLATGRVDSTLQTITDRGGIATVEHGNDRPDTRPEPETNRSEREPQRDDTARAQDDRVDDRPDTNRQDRGDQGPRDEPRDANSNSNDDVVARDRDSGDVRDNKSASDTSSSDKGASDKASADSGEQNMSDSNQQMAGQNKQGPQQNQGGAEAAQAAVQNPGLTPEQMLAGAVAGAAQQAQNTQGQQAQVVDPNAQAQNATSQNQAQTVVAAAATQQGAQKQQAGPQNGQAQNTGQGKADAQAAAQAQADASKNADKAASQPKTQTNAAQQAADLSQKLGEGQKLDVQVQVNREVVTDKAGQQAQAGANEQQPTLRSQQNPNAGQIGMAAQQTQQQNQNQAQQAQNAGAKQAVQAASGLDAKAAAPQAQVAQANLNSGPQGMVQADAAAAANTNTAGNTHTNAANDPKAIAQQTKPQSQAQNVADQVNVSITKALADGEDRISIQLKPAELGRVEVQLELAKDGKVSAVVTVEKQETLDQLKADAKQLEKALQDAGLQADSSSLSFNLREQGDGSAFAQNGNGKGGFGDQSAVSEDPVQAALEEVTENFVGIRPDGRVDFLA